MGMPSRGYEENLEISASAAKKIVKTIQKVLESRFPHIMNTNLEMYEQMSDAELFSFLNGEGVVDYLNENQKEFFIRSDGTIELLKN